MKEIVLPIEEYSDHYIFDIFFFIRTSHTFHFFAAWTMRFTVRQHTMTDFFLISTYEMLSIIYIIKKEKSIKQRTNWPAPLLHLFGNSQKRNVMSHERHPTNEMELLFISGRSLR